MRLSFRTLVRLSMLCVVASCACSVRVSDFFNGRHIYFRIPHVLAQSLYYQQQCPNGMSVIFTEGAWQYLGSRGFVQFGCKDRVGNFWINGTVYIPLTHTLNSALA